MRERERVRERERERELESETNEPRNGNIMKLKVSSGQSN